MLNYEQVRFAITRRLGINVAGLVPSNRHIEGMVEMLLEATQRYDMPLTEERLFGWHAAHFWFIIIHPFDDGNGRIARAITDMLLVRAEGSGERFYSM